MSVELMGLCFRSDLPPTQRLVALFLADRASADGGSIWPSTATVALNTGLSIRTVKSVIRGLRDSGVLVQTGEHKIRGGIIPVYSMSPERLSAGAAPGATDGNDPVQLTSRPGATAAPKPRTEPRSEPSSTRAREADEVFEAFWQAYPPEGRRYRPKVELAFRRALRQGVGGPVMVAGAARYAADPNRTPGFTKNAEKWLDGHGWADPPLPSREERPQPQRRTAADRPL